MPSSIARKSVLNDLLFLLSLMVAGVVTGIANGIVIVWKKQELALALQWLLFFVVTVVVFSLTKR